MLPNFFSVPMMAPDRWAALRADRPLTTFSLSTAVPPLARTLLPIRVTLSHSSSDILEFERVVEVAVRGMCISDRTVGEFG